MEGFAKMYHPWIIFNAWKSKIAYIFLTQMDLLDSCFLEVTFHATFALLT
jgi:hypothetical protein